MSSDDLLWRVHVLFLLRLVSKANRSAGYDPAEVTLSCAGSDMIFKGQGLPFHVPARGTWPSPIAVNAKSLVRKLREIAEPLVHLVFGGGHLWVNGSPLQAREL